MRKIPFLANNKLLFCSLLIASLANAQQRKPSQAELRVISDPLVQEADFSYERGTPQLITLKPEAAKLSPLQAKAALDNFLGTRSGVDELQAKGQVKISDNQEVQEYQQYFKGVKVDRASFKAYVQDNSVRFYNGAFYTIPADATTTPRLTEAQALDRAKQHVGAKKYVADELAEAAGKTTNRSVKTALLAELQQTAPKGELVFIQDFTKKGVAEARLAYKFNIYASQPLSREWVYVDAQNGKILLVDAIIKHLDDHPAPPPGSGSVPVTVQTRYAGARTIYTKQVSGTDPNNGQQLVSSHPTTEVYVPGSATYVLMDDTRGGGIETYDLNGVGGLPISVGPAYTLAKAFTDVDNNWTVAEHKRGVGPNASAEAENDDVAWDAQWGASVVYDYWKTQHNRLSFDGKDAKIKSYIHSGLAYDNAFWNGSVMTYGDGSGPEAAGFKSLTSLDVCGHEIGHGVCSYTSDLVYANESGAMNEGLSDIWAACIEYFAMKHIDTSLHYKPFYIGEQISADPAAPLRRMDNPKAAGNPDTYGGANWTSQDGCSPTLVNDECGVHNNSGVINKWFYLITVGSHSGSGPDAAYAGVDDGINDAVTTLDPARNHPANAYNVKGLGFKTAEKIVFLMETMLSSSATYDEARSVSIAAATAIGGDPCGRMVEAVTNAWYAVGVGGKFVKPCITTYGFVLTGSTVVESAVKSNCQSSRIFNIPVIMPASSTATITATGTANAADYTIPATLTNTKTTTARKNLQVTIKNDAAIEPDETINITIALTNTGSSPVNTNYTLTITDDDVAPVIGNGQKTLLSETFTRADGFNDPTGWIEKMEIAEAPNGDPTASGKNQWGVFDSALAVTGKDGVTGTKLPNRTYNDNSNSRSIVVSPQLDARGLTDLKIKFDYFVQGEVDPSGTDIENFPAFDYMAVCYSLDGVNFVELNSGDFRQFASATPVTGTLTANLPATLANKLFYLAFRWFNDTNAGGPFSTSIDNLQVLATAKQIESELGDNAQQVVSTSNDVLFYSTQDGEILSRTKASKGYGCTNVSVEKAGTGAFTLFGTNKAADKVIRMDATNSYVGSNKITLYYKEAELAGLEAATGIDRTGFVIYHVNAATYGGANSTNTTTSIPVYQALPGIGATYTFTSNGDLTGSYALGVQSGSLQRMVPIATTEATHWSFDAVYPNPSKSYLQYGITAPADKKVKVEIVNTTGQVVSSQSLVMSRGYKNLMLNTGTLGTGSYVVYIKDEKGKVLNRQIFIKE